MIRTIPAFSLALVLLAHPGAAQVTGTLNWGYLHAQRVAFDENLDDLTGTGTWTYADFDVGARITPGAFLVGGAGGFAVKNSFYFSDGVSAVSGSVEMTNVSVPVHARVFLNDATQKTRAFLDVGPSLNFQTYKIRMSLPGFEEKLEKTKIGALAGMGILFGKKPFRMVVRTRYHWVAKQGEFDASSFQFTVGGVFGAL